MCIAGIAIVSVCASVAAGAGYTSHEPPRPPRSPALLGLLNLAASERALHRDSLAHAMHRWQRAGREGADSGHAIPASRLHPVLDTGRSDQADPASTGWLPSTRLRYEDRGWQQVSRWPARVRDIHIAVLLWRQG